MGMLVFWSRWGALSSHLSLHQLFLNPTNQIFQNPHFSLSSNFSCSSSSRYNRRSFTHFRFDDEFKRRENRRNWWSDDDDDDDDSDDEDEEDSNFGFWGEPSTIVDWFFKIFRVFGWMVPAIMISTLFGTGSNSLIMAVVLPLGQTALSLVLDRLWVDPNSSSNFKTEPKPRRRSKSNFRYKRNPNVWNAGPGSREARSRSYQSWGEANNPSANKGGRSGSKYGGWDELEPQAASGINVSVEERQKVEVPQRVYVETSKLSRRINRDKPLFIRLLIAVFPLLGSWTRFLF